MEGKIIEPLESSRIKCKFNEEERILQAESSTVIVEIWKNAEPETWGVPVVEYWWKNHNRENDTIQKYSHLVTREEIVGEALMAKSFDRAFLKECGVPFGTAISIIKGRDELENMHNQPITKSPNLNENAESIKMSDDASFAVSKWASNSSEIPMSASNTGMPLSNNGLQELRQGDDDESAGDSSSDDGEGFGFRIGGGPPPSSADPHDDPAANSGGDAIYGNFANISLQKVENYASLDGNYASFQQLQNAKAQESRIPQNSKPVSQPIASIDEGANSDQEEESSDMPVGFSLGGMLSNNAQTGSNQVSHYANVSEMLPDQASMKSDRTPSNFSLEQSNTFAMTSNEAPEVLASSVLPSPPILMPDVSTLAPSSVSRGPSASQTRSNASHEVMDGKYYPNQEVEVLSATSEAWVRARVHVVKEGIVTVKYMDRQKELREDSTKIRLPKKTLNINGIEYIKNDFENISWRLRASLKANDMIKTKRMYMKKYQDVFCGADAIEILCGLEDIDKREDAELLAKELQRERAFASVPKKGKEFVNSKKHWYKFDDDKEAKDPYFATLEHKRTNHKPKRKEWTRGVGKIECCVRNNRQELQWVQASIEGYDQERDVIFVKPTKVEHRGAQRPWYDRYSDLLRPLSRPPRDKWSVEQGLKIYSKSKNEWMDGKIIQIYKSYVRVAYENQSKWMERESIKLRTE